MKYEELKKVFSLFHEGEISKIDLSAAIHLWQRAECFDVEDCPDVVTAWYDAQPATSFYLPLLQ